GDHESDRLGPRLELEVRLVDALAALLEIGDPPATVVDHVAAMSALLLGDLAETALVILLLLLRPVVLRSLLPVVPSIVRHGSIQQAALGPQPPQPEGARAFPVGTESVDEIDPGLRLGEIVLQVGQTPQRLLLV